MMFNPLKLSDNYIYHLFYQSVIVNSVFMALLWVSMKIAIIPLNSVNKLMFVMVKCGVLLRYGLNP
jgi:hypothetical protein